MKTIRFFGMVLMTILLSVGFAACSSDDDDPIDGMEIVGSWKQTNSYGTVITLTFNKNMTGVITYKYYDDGHETGSRTENFEYSYNTTEKIVKIYGDTQLEGEWDVTITATLLILEDYSSQYRFTKV